MICVILYIRYVVGGEISPAFHFYRIDWRLSMTLPALLRILPVLFFMQFVGFFFGKVFGARIRKGDRPEKCDTLEDILKMEG